MPRSHLNDAALLLDSEAAEAFSKLKDYSGSAEMARQLLQMLREKANLQEALGIGKSAAELLQATYEEVKDQSEDGFLIVCIVVVCFLCAAFGCWWDWNDKQQNPNRAVGVYWMQVKDESETQTAPSQMTMNEDGESSKQQLKTSLTEMVRKWSAKEWLALNVFARKFGSAEKKILESCVGEVRSQLPNLVSQADVEENVSPEDLGKAKKKDMRAMIKVYKAMAVAAMLEHGATVVREGLAGIGLGQCGHLLCGGDLQYKLDATGKHECTWHCPPGEVPDELRVLQATGAEIRMLDSLDATAENAAETEIEEDAEMPQSEVSKTKLWKSVSSLSYLWTQANSTEPIQLLKANSATELLPASPSAYKMEGICKKDV
mmetsp:Transcript_30164/g.56580  ORF Transcript_30164/g.56580 Transcript_30164/m.56580 type:complete len:375 (+) Transcript_30164:50-1174(+)